MSTSAVVDTAAVNVKTRRVRSVLLLTVVTFGVYGAFWYYTVNCELRDFGAAHGDLELGSSRPWRSLFAFEAQEGIGLVSYLRTARRLQAAERIAFGSAKSTRVLSAALLASAVLPWTPWVTHVWSITVLAAIVSSLLAMGLIQSRLNSAWHTAPSPVENSPADVAWRYADTVRR